MMVSGRKARKIRIVFVVNGFAIGGGEKKLLELVSRVRQSYADEFHLAVCSVGQGGPLQGEFEGTGVKTVVFPKKGKYDISLVWKVARLLKEEKADIVQTTLFYADVIGSLAARLAGIKRILSWEAITQPYSSKHLLAYRLAGKTFQYSIAVSRAIQKQVIAERHLPPPKTLTIPYGIDLEHFTPRLHSNWRGKMGFKQTDLLLGTVARLTRQKGHAFLLDAVPAVLKHFPQAHFLLAGDGPLKEDLQTQAERLGVRKAVHFLGFRPDVRDILNALDVFVLPSLYEGLPNAVLEAMACGLPVVATRVDGTPEAVQHNQTGILVPPENAGELARALISLLTRPDLMKRMGRAGRKRVESIFALETQIDQFVQLYRNSFFSRR